MNIKELTNLIGSFKDKENVGFSYNQLHMTILKSV